MKETNICHGIKIISRKNKELLFKYLFNLEMQEKLDSREPVSAFLRKDD